MSQETRPSLRPQKSKSLRPSLSGKKIRPGEPSSGRGGMNRRGGMQGKKGYNNRGREDRYGGRSGGLRRGGKDADHRGDGGRSGRGGGMRDRGTRSNRGGGFRGRGRGGRYDRNDRFDGSGGGAGGGSSGTWDRNNDGNFRDRDFRSNNNGGVGGGGGGGGSHHGSQRDFPGGPGGPQGGKDRSETWDRWSDRNNTDNRGATGNNNNNNSPPLPVDNPLNEDDPEEMKKFEEECNELGLPVPGPHDLNGSWTYWFDRRVIINRAKGSGGAIQFESNLKEVGTFSTVESFWSIFHYVCPPSDMVHGSNYHVFRTGIRPMWEDPANANGGRWILRMPHHDRGSLDFFWRNLVLAIIGEVLETSSDICGVVLGRKRRGDRIEIWNLDSENKDNVMKLGKFFQDAMIGEPVPPHPPVLNVQYVRHADAMQNGSGYSALYTM